MANVRINIDPTDKILLKRNLEKDGQAQRFFTSEVRRFADAYTPLDTGTLKSNVTLTANSITYNSPYSRKQYYENRGGGMRGKQWVSRMWSDRSKDIVQAVANFVGGRAE